MLVTEIKKYIKQYDLYNNMFVVRERGWFRISFLVRTTSTRAQSIVFRVRMIVKELNKENKVTVIGKTRSTGKWAPLPRNESTYWTIYIEVGTRKL